MGTSEPLGRLDRAGQPPATRPAGPSPHQGGKLQVELAARALALMPTPACIQSGECDTTKPFDFRERSAFSLAWMYIYIFFLYNEKVELPAPRAIFSSPFLKKGVSENGGFDELMKARQLFLFVFDHDPYCRG